MAHNDKTYAIIPIADLNNINYSEVEQTSADTVRKNIAENLFIVKWEGVTPASISVLTGVVEYTHEEILIEISSLDWSSGLPT